MMEENKGMSKKLLFKEVILEFYSIITRILLKKNFKMLSEIISEPFEIQFVKLSDRFNTVVGFEFTYTGIEPELDESKIDQALLMMHQINLRNNPNLVKIQDNCPLLLEYLHNDYRIEVVQEYNNLENIHVYRIKVLQYALTYKTDNTFNERFMGIPVDFETNQYRKPKLEEWPLYLVAYVEEEEIWVGIIYY